MERKNSHLRKRFKWEPAKADKYAMRLLTSVPEPVKIKAREVLQELEAEGKMTFMGFHSQNGAPIWSSKIKYAPEIMNRFQKIGLDTAIATDTTNF
jgi:hypothetical protein